VRLWPESSSESGDVIAKFRPNDNLKISETRKLTVPIICSMYQESLQKIIMKMKEDGNSINSDLNHYTFYHLNYEREIVLLTKVCTSQWFDYEAYKYTTA